MGGRKGYSLRKLVGNIRNIRVEKRDLLDAIDHSDVTKVVSTSAKILAKSNNVLESLTHVFLFIDSLKNDYDKLRKESTKARRLDISKRWARYRKEKGVDFDDSINRDIVDTATRTLGGVK
jgi:hypothetical protein